MLPANAPQEKPSPSASARRRWRAGPIGDVARVRIRFLHDGARQRDVAPGTRVVSKLPVRVASPALRDRLVARARVECAARDESIACGSPSAFGESTAAPESASAPVASWPYWLLPAQWERRPFQSGPEGRSVRGARGRPGNGSGPAAAGSTSVAPTAARPSCPRAPGPQQYTAPLAVTAHASVPPTAIETTGSLASPAPPSTTSATSMPASSGASVAIVVISASPGRVASA